jgi:hypothetical protein
MLCIANKYQNDCHSRAGESPVQRRLDSHLRGNDEWVAPVVKNIILDNISATQHSLGIATPKDFPPP